MEWKQRELVERSCIFGSISIFSKESEQLERSKEKEIELSKSKRVKENECFTETQESEKEEQREKEIVILENSEEELKTKEGTWRKSLATFLKIYHGSMFDLSCHDFGVMNNASIESIAVGFGLDGALFDILHDKCLGKCVLSMLDVFLLSLLLL
ncbi:hypothetical protein M9H77_12888 [Catharanthus roseus]|uniref:Uncharacterized protein n=1 Tax=Catharanthus roseus TaxID=4058 RepID=A0ACC0BIT2_CATRO|nr:hypothetical protein M9H77_12888 [Catharanthus roseus]